MASLVHQVTKIPVIMRWLPPKRVDHDLQIMIGGGWGLGWWWRWVAVGGRG